MSASCHTTESPDPSYRGLVATVDETSFVTLGGRLPPEGTLLGSALWKSIFSADYRKNFSEFVYLFQGGNDSKGNGILHFGPNKTEEEANTPYRTTSSYDEFYWDGILYCLVFIKDIVTSQYRVREVYVPGGKRGTMFITDEFLSPVPFNVPFYEAPVPTSVTYDVPGAHGGFPECLHPRMQIPMIGGGIITDIIGDPQALGGDLSRQTFPETNVLEWDERVIVDRQKLGPAGYERTRVTVLPPEVSDANVK